VRMPVARLKSHRAWPSIVLKLFDFLFSVTAGGPSDRHQNRDERPAANAVAGISWCLPVVYTSSMSEIFFLSHLGIYQVYTWHISLLGQSAEQPLHLWSTRIPGPQGPGHPTRQAVTLVPVPVNRDPGRDRPTVTVAMQLAGCGSGFGTGIVSVILGV
jgi:hypothetical protein